MLFFRPFLSYLRRKIWSHDHAGMPKILYKKWSFLTVFSNLLDLQVPPVWGYNAQNLIDWCLGSGQHFGKKIKFF